MYQTAKVAKVLLLMNAGKGLEYKGKSLNDIELSDDVLNNDDDDNDDDTNNVDDGNNSENDNNSSTNRNFGGDMNKKLNCRIRWNPEEKEIALNFFKDNIKKKILPKKDECINFIQQHLKKFKESEWRRIKILIYNTYRNK